MNNKTCYTFLISNVLKTDTKDFASFLRERLIRQLDHDFKIGEGMEIKLRNEFADVVLSKSNNDKKILGTINHHIEGCLKYPDYQGGVDNWDDVKVSSILNDDLLKTKIPMHESKTGHPYFKPVELMDRLLKL
ncbi:MAG TPA: hypothetical protein VEW65_13070 [Chryseolinea sp.]|nr:hypothetical protein [Chryseolinea sp.]